MMRGRVGAVAQHLEPTMTLARTVLFLTPLVCASSVAAACPGDPDPIVPLAPFSVRVGGPQIDIEAERPDLHGPIGVLGEHAPFVGAWQFSYRYVRTDSKGLADGKADVSEQDLFDLGYQRAPTKLVREEHLFSALYGYSETLSLLITLPWISNDMAFMTDTGGTYSQRAIGMGDLELSGLYDLINEENQRAHLNLGVTLPTGSHDERSPIPGSGGKSVKLPYPLQLGSGTLDLVPGVTWVRLEEDTSWGAQLIQTVRFGTNSDDYRVGNETLATAWIARRFQEDLSGSLRMEYIYTGRTAGRDTELDPSFDPSQDPWAQGGDRLNLFLGINYTQAGGHRFAAEFGGPMFQDLNGPQLETDVIYMIGWRYSF
jgi:Putative MetA-pathway of phenol degradation